MQRLLAVAALAFIVLLSASPGSAQSDADLLAARAAYDRGDRARLDALASKLEGHVLAPYVEYWQLRLGLDAASDDDVRRYLARWPQTPTADRLRVEWLKVLGKRGSWTTFAAEYPPPSGEDLELGCYGIQYRRQHDGDSALAAAKPLWFTGQATPAGCEPLFAALIASGELSTDDRRARFRLAVEAGNTRLAQAIANDLPSTERIAQREFAGVDGNPSAALTRGDFQWKQQSGRDLALYALERAARTDAAGVRAAWVKQRNRLPEADRLYGNGRIAYHAARQLYPQAAEWYREAQGATLSEAQRAWRVRAALRAGYWADVLATIESMPPSEAQESAWRYWKARALVAARRKEEATAIYDGLTGDLSFYGLLAREAVGGREIEPVSMPLEPDPAELAAFGARPAVRRVLKLAQLDMRPESQREWIYIVRGLPDEALLLAADFARREGLYDRAINTAERTSTRHDYGLRYLMPYREQFSAAAREHAVDPALLFGIARQESRFAADIVSSAGAIGLMQLMPPTAVWVARQLNVVDYRPSRISDVAINTQFGAFYYKYWLERLDQLPVLAAAAYNAGPRRAQAWRGAAPLEGAVWVESIPFNETRDYVKKVLANTVVYAHLMKQTYVPLATRLGVVPPLRAAEAPIAAAGG